MSDSLARSGLGLEELIELLHRDGPFPNRWERIGMIQVKYNRMILFNSRMFHSHVFEFERASVSRPRLTFVCYGR